MEVDSMHSAIDFQRKHLQRTDNQITSFMAGIDRGNQNASLYRITTRIKLTGCKCSMATVSTDQKTTPFYLLISYSRLHLSENKGRWRWSYIRNGFWLRASWRESSAKHNPTSWFVSRTAVVFVWCHSTTCTWSSQRCPLSTVGGWKVYVWKSSCRGTVTGSVTATASSVDRKSTKKPRDDNQQANDQDTRNSHQ